MLRFLSLAAALLLAPPALASEAVQQVTLAAHVESRTSLRVSTSTLSFVVPADGDTVTASVDYMAAARTQRDAQVVLSVELLRSIDGPGGAADAETTLSVDSDIAGSQQMSSTPVRAARWTGSGLREGRLTFRLAAAAPGVYAVPVRIVISVP